VPRKKLSPLGYRIYKRKVQPSEHARMLEVLLRKRTYDEDIIGVNGEEWIRLVVYTFVKPREGWQPQEAIALKFDPVRDGITHKANGGEIRIYPDFSIAYNIPQESEAKGLKFKGPRSREQMKGALSKLLERVMRSRGLDYGGDDFIVARVMEALAWWKYNDRASALRAARGEKREKWFDWKKRRKAAGQRWSADLFVETVYGDLLPLGMGQLHLKRWDPIGYQAFHQWCRYHKQDPYELLEGSMIRPEAEIEKNGGRVPTPAEARAMVGVSIVEATKMWRTYKAMLRRKSEGKAKQKKRLQRQNSQ